ncbi:GtrA family protein [Motilibacter aurantiacus]|uniref:GtrA family protein n=1 Tax=Motilibacter aurantiacus TaxID=2714955 RepID=UPI0038B27461
MVNTGAYYGPYLALLPLVGYVAAHLIGFVISLLVSFVLNSKLTFRVPMTWRRLALYPLTNLTNFLVTTTGVLVLVNALAVDETFAPLIASAPAIPATFVVTRLVLAGRRHRSAATDERGAAGTVQAGLLSAGPATPRAPHAAPPASLGSG